MSAYLSIKKTLAKIHQNRQCFGLLFMLKSALKTDKILTVFWVHFFPLKSSPKIDHILTVFSALFFCVWTRPKKRPKTKQTKLWTCFGGVFCLNPFKKINQASQNYEPGLGEFMLKFALKKTNGSSAKCFGRAFVQSPSTNALKPSNKIGRKKKLEKQHHNLGHHWGPIGRPLGTSQHSRFEGPFN